MTVPMPSVSPNRGMGPILHFKYEFIALCGYRRVLADLKEVLAHHTGTGNSLLSDSIGSTASQSAINAALFALQLWSSQFSSIWCRLSLFSRVYHRIIRSILQFNSISVDSSAEDGISRLSSLPDTSRDPLRSWVTALHNSIWNSFESIIRYIICCFWHHLTHNIIFRVILRELKLLITLEPKNNDWGIRIDG